METPPHGAVDSADADRSERSRFAQTWAQATRGIGFVPSGAIETERRLRTLTRDLVRALVDTPFSDAPAYRVGAALVQAHLTDPAALDATLRVIGTSLPAVAGSGLAGMEADELSRRLVALQAALATGYARALRDATMAEQERLNRAVLDAHGAVEVALRASEARFRAIFAGAATGIGIADMDGRIVQVNHAFCRLLGYSAEELCRLNVRDLTHPADFVGMWEMYAEVVRGERDHVRLDKAYYRKDGDVVWTDLAVSLVRDEAGAPRFTVAMLTDVTERHRLQQRLRHEASHDPLTGLPNRAAAADRLEEIFTAPDPHARVGLCYLDLDGFKRVNDTLGHHVGDQLLVAVARRLEELAVQRDVLVARMGGDEFVLLAGATDGPGQMAALAEATLDTLAPPFQIGPHRLRVAASIGVVERGAADATPAEFMRAADLTLYDAKTDGRGRWAMYDADRNASEVVRYALAAALPDALDRGEFSLAYQPLVRLSDGALRGVEALLRWHHHELGPIHPAEFIALAEETGLIVPLGAWAMTTACAQLAAWQGEFPEADLFVSVNAAAAQAHEPAFADELLDTLARTAVDPARLQLELTETEAMRTQGEPLRALRTLSSHGVRLAIDDFGTGYSNLTYLRRLPLSTLKLAGSLVHGLGTASRRNRTDEQIVGAIIRLAHDLDLTVTAEGVETRTQADRLRDFGCDTAQGWLFAGPRTAAGIGDLLAAAPVGLPA